MKKPLSAELITRVKNELAELDHLTVDVDGVQLKPSQCYHFDVDPAHVLFNTNCPDNLRTRVESILSRYTQSDEGSTQQR
ncbi:MAG: hypothetical protein EOO09_21095 [Chitinophagaceae bacterium]|nr:MAG: hypothetical protein EOO09_21095 [Chitinophagaceae bacterium]